MYTQEQAEVKLMRKRLVEAINRGDLTQEEVEKTCKAIGMDFKMPLKVTDTAFLWRRGRDVALCQHPHGTNGSMRDEDKYVETTLMTKIDREFPDWKGGTEVMVTIEEVL